MNEKYGGKEEAKAVLKMREGGGGGGGRREGERRDAALTQEGGITHALLSDYVTHNSRHCCNSITKTSCKTGEKGQTEMRSWRRRRSSKPNTERPCKTFGA